MLFKIIFFFFYPRKRSQEGKRCSCISMTHIAFLQLPTTHTFPGHFFNMLEAYTFGPLDCSFRFFAWNLHFINWVQIMMEKSYACTVAGELSEWKISDNQKISTLKISGNMFAVLCFSEHFRKFSVAIIFWFSERNFKIFSQKTDMTYEQDVWKTFFSFRCSY